MAPLGRMVFQVEDLIDEITGRTDDEVIVIRRSFRGDSRIRSADDRDSCQPGVVELRGRFMEMARRGKITDRDDKIDIRVIVPPGVVPDLETQPRLFPKTCCKQGIGEFGRKIGTVSQKGRCLETLAPVRVTGDQAGLGPVRHEAGTGQALGMGLVLQNLELGARVGEEIGGDRCDELPPGCAESFREKVAQRDDDTLFRKFGDETGVGRTAEFHQV